jgi:hypothetical protein
LIVSGSNKKLAILNAETGAIIVMLPFGSKSDGVDYDPGLGRLPPTDYREIVPGVIAAKSNVPPKIPQAKQAIYLHTPIFSRSA